MTVETGSDPKLLVVLPCFNEAKTLPTVLDSLLRGEAAEGWLIVIVDGGSTDGTVEFAQSVAARDARVVLLPNPRRLQSAGVNLAAQRHGEGRDWLVRMDAHAAYPNGFVANLVRTAQQTGANSVVVPMLTVGEPCFQRAVATAQNSRLGTGGASHRRLSGGGWVDHGHHALFGLPTFLALGGYDETFVANEDAELDFRLTQAGGRIWLADDLAIVYHPRATARRLFTQYLKHGAGRARTILRHRVRPKARQLAPAAVAPAVLLLVPAVFFAPLAGPAVIWALISLLYGGWLGLKQRDRCAFLAGPAAMIMHLAWSLGFWSRILRGPGPGFAGIPSSAASPQ